MEVLIAMAIGVAVLIPALGVFSIVVRGAAESTAALRARTAADISTTSAAAAIRAGAEVPGLRSVEAGSYHLVIRSWQSGDSATNRVEAVATAGDGSQRSASLILFPPLRTVGGGAQ